MWDLNFLWTWFWSTFTNKWERLNPLWMGLIICVVWVMSTLTQALGWTLGASERCCPSRCCSGTSLCAPPWTPRSWKETHSCGQEPERITTIKKKKPARIVFFCWHILFHTWHNVVFRNDISQIRCCCRPLLAKAIMAHLCYSKLNSWYRHMHVHSRCYFNTLLILIQCYIIDIQRAITLEQKHWHLLTPHIPPTVTTQLQQDYSH